MLQHFMYHKTVKVVDFEETELLSTYLYTVNAGPYRVYKHVGGEVP
jgi:aminopeptidase N